MYVVELRQQQSALANISRRIVKLHKEFYGKGPTKAKTYYQDDLVVVLMRGGFTRVEQTLLKEGKGSAVIDQRMQFQEVMHDRFKEVIRDELGRTVTGFMSGSQQEPDLIAEVFVLEPHGEGILDGTPADCGPGVASGEP